MPVIIAAKHKDPFNTTLILPQLQMLKGNCNTIHNQTATLTTTRASCPYSPTSANVPCNVFHFSLCLHKNNSLGILLTAYFLQQRRQSETEAILTTTSTVFEYFNDCHQPLPRL
jgi:hypothetical protein